MNPGSQPIVDFPSVDWTQLIPQLVSLWFEGIGKYVSDTLRHAFDGLWGSGLNVVGRTDPAMTWGFGPVTDQVASAAGAARAVLLCALVLLGLKSMLGGLIRSHADVLGEFVNGVLLSVIMVAAFPVIIPQLIDLTNAAAATVGKADLSRYVRTSGVDNPLFEAILFVVLALFALRLLIRAAWRVMFLAVLLPVGVVACAVYAIPSLRWLLGWWARLWGGMLLAQVPSVMALSIGAQLFAFGGGGLGSFVYSIAALQLATDLYHLIPFGGGGGSHGAPWGSLPWRAAGLASALSAPTVPAGVVAARLGGLAAMDRATAREAFYGYD